VILFLHGSGERGADGEKPTLVGIGPRIRSDIDGFPAIVVFPQAPENGEWSQVTPMVLAQLEAATREFGGDRRRTYLTGLSMGGFGVWDLALKQPGRFAALAPVCGGLIIPRRPSMNVTGLDGLTDPYAAVAARVKDIPIWQFHGARDDLVPPDYSRRMDAALKAAGARDARYTEFPEANHNSWDPAYSQTPEFWTWLFAQRRMT
jgi:predicted peptidase